MRTQTGNSAELLGNRSTAVRGIFALLVAATASACAAVADQSIQTSSLTKEIGYPVSTSEPLAAKRVAVTQNAIKLERTAYLGRAPYICTPSGFGTTSRCFLR